MRPCTMDVLLALSNKSTRQAWPSPPPHENSRKGYLPGNRAGNSHPPTRQRERRISRFNTPGHAQRYLATGNLIASHVRPGCQLLPTSIYRQEMRQRLQSWQEMTSLADAASASLLMHSCTGFPGTRVDRRPVDQAHLFSLDRPWPPRERIPESASEGHVRQHLVTPSPVLETHRESCHPSSQVRPRAESSHR
jgi:hypothetical protein